MSLADQNPPRKSRRRGSAGVQAKPSPCAIRPVAGRFSPLHSNDLEQIHQKSLEILEQIGLGEAPEIVAQTLTAAGGSVSADNRVTVPRALVTAVLKDLN